MNPTNNIAAGFETFEQKSDNFAEVRKNALEAFLKLGFPTSKHEEWKYTSLKDAEQVNYGEAPLQISGLLNSELISKLNIGNHDSHLLVFENGCFHSELSASSPEGLTIGNLATFRNDAAVRKYLGNVAVHHDESFVALNTAFHLDGTFIHVPASTSLKKPVHILHINTSAKATMSRILIVAEQGAKVNFSESYHSFSDKDSCMTNNVTEIVVGKNASVSLVKAQLENEDTSHVSFTQVNQEQDSRFSSTVFTTGGKVVRNNLHIRLNGTNCQSILYGLYLLSGNQLCDNHTLVDHAMPHCESNELYKGVLDGKSTGVFNGKIFVRQDAQKTNAYQSNKNILLSDNAQMNTKPQLEIFADDVKCTHGTTTGQLDEEALFYLRARGIGEQAARTLLNIAFAGDVLNHIEDDTLRENLKTIAENKLMLS